MLTKKIADQPALALINRRCQIGQLLCPTDLSRDSNHALYYATALARAFQAQLTICYCPEKLPVEALGLYQTVFSKLLKRFSTKRKLNKLCWNAEVIAGAPELIIPEEARALKSDLIVMQSRRRPFGAARLGSTATSICRTAPCPVLVVHTPERDWQEIWQGQIKLEKILIAHDFSINSELALAYGLSLAQEFQTELHLLHVLPNTKSVLRSNEMIAEASRCLREVVPTEAFNWCNVQYSISIGKPANQILNYASERNIDLICLGASRPSVATDRIFGSNVDEVLNTSPCPVLVARR